MFCHPLGCMTSSITMCFLPLETGSLSRYLHAKGLAMPPTLMLLFFAAYSSHTQLLSHNTNLQESTSENCNLCQPQIKGINEESCFCQQFQERGADGATLHGHRGARAPHTPTGPACPHQWGGGTPSTASPQAAAPRGQTVDLIV